MGEGYGRAVVMFGVICCNLLRFTEVGQDEILAARVVWRRGYRDVFPFIYLLASSIETLMWITFGKWIIIFFFKYGMIF